MNIHALFLLALSLLASGIAAAEELVLSRQDVSELQSLSHKLSLPALIDGARGVIDFETTDQLFPNNLSLGVKLVRGTLHRLDNAEGMAEARTQVLLTFPRDTSLLSKASGALHKGDHAHPLKETRVGSESVTFLFDDADEFEGPTCSHQTLSESAPSRGHSLRSGPSLVYQVALDVDNEFIAARGTLQQALQDIATIMNGVAAVYARDLQIEVRITYLHLWLSPAASEQAPSPTPTLRVTKALDPYDTHDIGLMLASMGSSGVIPSSVGYDSLHLFSGRTTTHQSGQYRPLWGYAVGRCRGLSVNVASNTSAASQYGARFSITAHELGHNIGFGHSPVEYFTSPHTGGSLRDVMFGQGSSTTSTGFGPSSVSELPSLSTTVARCLRSLEAPPVFLGMTPNPLQYTWDAPLTVTEGSTVTIVANVTSNELLDVQWYKAGAPVGWHYFPRTSSLTLTTPPLTLADSGLVWGAFIDAPAGSTATPQLRIQVVPRPVCDLDLDQNGTVTVNDLFEFLNSWFQNSVTADYDRDGVVSPNDIFVYLNRWFQAANGSC
jgi:hypothetical protein